MNRYIFPIIAAMIFPGVALAITVTGDASVIILNAITATQTQEMKFGSVLPGAAAGVVTLSPAGATSSATLGTYGSGSPGRFTITAQPSTPLTVTFGNGTVTSGSNSMTINTFTSTPASGSIATDVEGKVTLSIGANLNVGANQAAGSYVGTYTVTVSY